MPTAPDDWLEAFRMMILVMVGGCFFMSLIGVARLFKRYKMGANRVCIPLAAMLTIFIGLDLAVLGAAAQILFWISREIPFAWYRSPLIFITVLVISLAYTQIVNFIFPLRRDKDEPDAHH